MGLFTRVNGIWRSLDNSSPIILYKPIGNIIGFTIKYFNIPSNYAVAGNIIRPDINISTNEMDLSEKTVQISFNISNDYKRIDKVDVSSIALILFDSGDIITLKDIEEINKSNYNVFGNCKELKSIYNVYTNKFMLSAEIEYDLTALIHNCRFYTHEITEITDNTNHNVGKKTYDNIDMFNAGSVRRDTFMDFKKDKDNIITNHNGTITHRYKAIKIDGKSYPFSIEYDGSHTAALSALNSGMYRKILYNGSGFSKGKESGGL